MQAQRNRQKSEHVESQKSRPEAVFGDKRPVPSRLERQEARPEAVLDARRPVRIPSWPAGGPPGAVVDAKRPVRRPSWTPGGPSGGRLGRQEGGPQAVLAVRRPECRDYCKFAAKCTLNCAGGRQAQVAESAPRRQAQLHNICIDLVDIMANHQSFIIFEYFENCLLIFNELQNRSFPIFS